MDQDELANLDRKTLKIMSMNGALHTRSNVARLYLPRKVRGRGLISVTECVEMKTRSLHGYLVESQDWMLKATWEDKEVVVTTDSLERVTICCTNRSKKYDHECGEKWYEHQPLPVIENDQVKLVWDRTGVTNIRVLHNSCSGAIGFRGPRDSRKTARIGRTT